jgi:RNA polymerase sigma-70 factor (ECF subfamily)
MQDSRADRALLVAIDDGDRRALDELYDRHAPWLLLRLRRRCVDDGLVEEVVQDTFVRAWRKADSYRGDGDVGAWLWSIAVRRLIDLLRKRVPTPIADISPTPAHGLSVEEQVLLDVEHGDLGAAINGLSPELRVVVQAVLVDGLTTREAARFLRIPAGTVKTRMMRAKPLLRERLT